MRADLARAAAARADHRRLIRLTGDFHLLLAELLRNSIMVRMKRGQGIAAR